MRNKTLTITQIKILLTIYDLNARDYYPLNAGLYKILTGVEDEETIKFIHLETFSTMGSSTSSKRFCSYTLNLFRHGYIDKIYDEVTDKEYFKITSFGSSVLENILKNNKPYFKKKINSITPTIIKIK